MRIGIFGGCFNPPHNKHREIALDLIKNDYVDKVIYVPTGDYYDKDGLILQEMRINMLKLMIDDMPNLFVSDICKNKKYQYTNSVLDYFQNKYKSSKIYFIYGSDNILEFSKWKNHDDILKKYYILVVDRNNINLSKLSKRLVDSIILTNLDTSKICSTDIREKIKNGDYNCEVDRKVLQYIKDNNLYEG